MLSPSPAVFEIPNITFLSETLYVREGDSLTIDCVARGIPAPLVDIVKYEDLGDVVPTLGLSASRTYEVRIYVICFLSDFC